MGFGDYKGGEVLFIFRICVDDDQFTPSNFKTAPRYIFGHTQTHNTRNYDDRLMRSIFSAHRYTQRVGVTNVKPIDILEEEALQKPKIISEKTLLNYNPIALNKYETTASNIRISYCNQ